MKTTSMKPGLASIAACIQVIALVASNVHAANNKDNLQQTPGKPVTAWQAGNLDIHHIATGRGSSSFVIMPDGTSILIDAGASNNTLDVSAAPKPGEDKRPGEWIARYIQRHLPVRQKNKEGNELDYLLVTHFHPDHLGDVAANSPLSRKGNYKLGGVSDVAELIKVNTIIDRAYPAYDYPQTSSAPFFDNYRAFIRAREQTGGVTQQLIVGSAQQFKMRQHFPVTGDFHIRNLAANGVYWSGQGEKVISLFPPLKQLEKSAYPDENMCSIAIKIQHGKFSYFTGGDLTSNTYDGEMPWRDVLTPAARVAGKVDVATADHHGMFDALNGDIVRALRPKTWVVSTWHIAHPDTLQLERMLSPYLYSGKREIYATSMMRENILVNKRLMRQVASSDGHILIRVAPDGASYTVIVTDNNDERDIVKLQNEVFRAGD